MSSAASSQVDMGRAPTSLATSPPSSPPPMDGPELRDPFVDEDDVEDDSGDLDAAFLSKKVIEEEERAQRQNLAAEKKRQAAKARKKRSGPLSEAERAQKAADLERLLDKSEQFGNSLREQTQALGRIGTGLDGTKLGAQNVEMAEQPRSVVHGTMRPYQLEGLTWMYELCSKGLPGGILADEMGLGKTVQTISLIAKLREDIGHYGPHLIVAPLSTLSNWIEEFHRWTPSIPVVMYHGVVKEREAIRRTKLTPNLVRQGGRLEPNDKFPVVCTTYEMVLKDHAALKKIEWGEIIIDEGHRMKNRATKLFETLLEFTSETRFLITGTPLQNDLQELFSLLHFLVPKVFRDWESFQSWFDLDELEDEEGTEDFINDKKKQEHVAKLHFILQPLLLRRVKADVAQYLPKKREYVLYAPMTKEQTDLYKAITDKDVDTREYLLNKAVETLTSVTPKDERPSKTTSRSSRSSAKKITAVETLGGKQASLPLRGKEQASEDAEPAARNAFSIMMKPRDRGRPKNSTPEKTTPTSVKRGAKRKESPMVHTPASKSTKSSRDSTPSVSLRGRLRKTRNSAVLDDSDDDDALPDDVFEQKLAEKYADVKDEESASPEPDKSELALGIQEAKKQIAQKKLGNVLMQLRHVCNSPHIFWNPWEFEKGPAVDERIVTASGKMLLLDRLLPTLFERGHKVLIFSQFKKQLNILEQYCRDLKGWKLCRLDGSVAQDDRRAQIAEFNESPEHKIFLLSTRAGGQGINLAAADTVILFDNDWNPQQDLQAQDRAHRIGQTRPVVVYRFATKNTVEESMLMTADAKRRLEKLVIKKGGFRTLGQKMELQQELDEDILQSLLLKDGEVYNFSGAKEILSDRDLDVLCDRSDEAYTHAAKGAGDADGYKVVETRAEGIATL